MLDKANRGGEPSAEILRAIRHGVAAAACRSAFSSTGDDKWAKAASHHHEVSRQHLHQAAARSLSA